MILRVLVCIPTYNNSASIEQVTLDALEQTPYSVLLVDDGSDQHVRELLTSPLCAEAFKSGRLHVERFEKNCGKGVALQYAIQWAVGRGFTHLLAVDGDGQHLIAESVKLLAAGRENPWDLIIGKRRLEGAHIPGSTLFGRKFSNFWVGYQTGRAIEDSQSGYRLYPLFQLQNWRFFTKRYDFEIEVLIRLLWNGIGVTEVEIDVYYPPPAERVSHFDKLWDNVRISALNTLLVVLTMLRQNLTQGKSAAAVGLGVFIGSTPFFGFHTPIAAFAALSLRLNAVLVFLGSNVSIPPIAVFLIPAEIAVGKHWLGISSTPLAWLAGSMVVGTFLGTLTSIVVYFVTGRFQPARARSAASNWTGKTRGGRFGNGFLRLVIRYLGLRTAYVCLLFVVPYFYLFAPKARRAGAEYWRMLEPQAGFFRRLALTMKQMYRFGQILMDRGYQSFAHEARFHVNSHGMKHILTPIREKQPLLIVSAHAGGWDLAAALLRTEGLWGRFHMVHYQFDGLTFEKVMGTRERAEHVNSLVITREPILQIKQMLEQAEPVGLMADRSTGSQFELVKFFGHLAPFDTRPFRIAASCRCQLLVTFGFKGAGQSYDLFAEPARRYVYDDARPREVQVREWVQDYALALEAMLRRYPEQWFNFYPFFSSRPKAPPGMTASQERHYLEQEWSTPPPAPLASAPDPTPSDAAGSLASSNPKEEHRA